MGHRAAIMSHLLGLVAARAGLVAIVVIIVVTPADRARALQAEVRSQDVEFVSGDVTLRGTVLLPPTAGPHPAMALLAGSGAGPRDKYRLEAEAFARAGVATLIYDKRTRGYSATERSYADLAGDALAAVNRLRNHPDIDPSAVGLWGHSEGGWVAPLAASRSSDVAFVVTVGASSVPGARQTVWAFGNRLRSMGVSGSMVDRFLPALFRVLVSSGAFPQADYDGVDALQRMQQPVLAIWGSQDHTVPPAESSRATAQALERGGNNHYAIRFVPGEHAAHTTPDGFERGDTLAPGYAETVTSWVHDVAAGTPQPRLVEDPPAQEHRSAPIMPIAPHQSAALQIPLFALLVTAFLSYPITALIRRFRGRAGPPPSSVRRAARWLSAAGLLTALGVPAIVLLLFAGIAEPVILQRPLPWLFLHALALAIVILAIRLAIGWRSSTAATRAETSRLAALLAGAVLFVPWAAYWGVLFP